MFMTCVLDHGAGVVKVKIPEHRQVDNTYLNSNTDQVALGVEPHFRGTWESLGGPR